jgi:thiamine-phosphate pyrophosphorylase
VKAALAGGASAIQYRNKSDDQQLRTQQAEQLLALCRAYDALLIINDDVDLARRLGADGVHLGREDMPLPEARTVLGQGALIGVSCYDSLARAIEAHGGGADYVAFGSFFPSAVKPETVRAPRELLREARGVLDLPVVAIGGITQHNAHLLIEAGADAVAVISALFHVPDTRAAAQAFAALFAARDKSELI